MNRSSEKRGKCCCIQNKRWNEILGKMILEGKKGLEGVCS
jgi:hypothetical protein